MGGMGRGWGGEVEGAGGGGVAGWVGGWVGGGGGREEREKKKREREAFIRYSRRRVQGIASSVAGSASPCSI